MAYRGKHRKSSAASRNVARVAVAGMAVGAPLALATVPAQASSVDWDAVAQCESSGNWHANTGNGFYGGLQFTKSTWHSFGGSGNPANASRSEQISVAENVLDAQGIGAWPNCGPKGLSGGSSSSGGGSEASASTQQAETQQQTEYQQQSQQQSSQQSQSQQSSSSAGVTKDNPEGEYTVQQGDTLGKIAKEHDVQGGYQQIYQLNKDYLSSPNLIIAGQQLELQ